MEERRVAQKQLQKKKKKQMEEEKKKMEKQIDSAKTFQSWQVSESSVSKCFYQTNKIYADLCIYLLTFVPLIQASIDERKKAKRDEERKRKLEEKQKQEENEIEKRENAEAAFKAWTEQKNNLEKERRGRVSRVLHFYTLILELFLKIKNGPLIISYFIFSEKEERCK